VAQKPGAIGAADLLRIVWESYDLRSRRSKITLKRKS